MLKVDRQSNVYIVGMFLSTINDAINNRTQVSIDAKATSDSFNGTRVDRQSNVHIVGMFLSSISLFSNFI